MEGLLYVKYGVVAILVSISLGLTFLAIRKLADFLIGMFAIGAVIAISTSIYNGTVTTWPEIIGVSTLAGCAVGLICVPLLPFSSDFSKVSPGSRTEQKVAPEPVQSALPD